MHLDLPAPLKSLSLRAALALPGPALRVIAGRPVRRDGQTLDLESQAALLLMKLTREPVLGTQPVAAGRRLMASQARMIGGTPPVAAITSLTVAGRPARLYVPSVPTDALLVFFHGGAWMYGDLDTHDGPCRALAEQAGVRVLAVDYRLAPEHPFPTPYDDCLAAYRWVLENLTAVGASADRLAVGGDSAGGNLAAAVALEAAEQGLPLAFQLLIYPATDLRDRETASHHQFAEGFYLTAAMMDLGVDSYLPDHADRAHPRASVLVADIPAGLAPAYICTAGFDPLRDEGEAYADKLEAAGVDVELERFSGLLHGFVNWTGAGRSGPAAVSRLADRLSAGLARTPQSPA